MQEDIKINLRDTWHEDAAWIHQASDSSGGRFMLIW
jgi:hypothetical protein